MQKSKHELSAENDTFSKERTVNAPSDDMALSDIFVQRTPPQGLAQTTATASSGATARKLEGKDSPPLPMTDGTARRMSQQIRHLDVPAAKAERTALSGQRGLLQLASEPKSNAEGGIAERLAKHLAASAEPDLQGMKAARGMRTNISIAFLAIFIAAASGAILDHFSREAPLGKLSNEQKLGALLPPVVWLDLLSHESHSPSGQAAESMSADQALTLADEKLHPPGGAADIEEARFWLRTGVRTMMMDNKRLQWALTQLGTLYAGPGATASSLATAHSLWDLASAGSDPLAICFLAALEEESQTPSGKSLALRLYKQAKELGNCSAAETAIERLSH